MRRLKGLVILLGLLAMGLVAHWAPHAGAAGPNSPPAVAQREASCPQPAIEILMGRWGLGEETAHGELPSDEEPLRFDCGTGETWRHHVP